MEEVIKVHEPLLERIVTRRLEVSPFSLLKIVRGRYTVHNTVGTQSVNLNKLGVMLTPFSLLENIFFDSMSLLFVIEGV